MIRCGAKVKELSRVKGWTTLKPEVSRFHVSTGGVDGDYNHYRTTSMKSTPDRAVSIITTDVLASLNGAGWPTKPGELGENLLVDGFPYGAFRIGASYKFGAELVVQITEAIVPCGYLCTLPYLREKWRCQDFLRTLQGRRGWYGKVIVQGSVGQGDLVVAMS